jgi:hypothetical protein
MRSLPEWARPEIEINELRVARGIVDESSVRVEIDGRRPEADETPGILAEYEKLPPHLPPHVREDLTHVEDASGRLWLLPKENVEKLRDVRLPDAVPPAIQAAQDYAERLLRAHIPDFDAHPAGVRATWLIETIKRLNKAGDSIYDLGRYLAFAEPNKVRAREPLEDSYRAVLAAILKDVYGMKPKEIRKKLEREPLSAEARREGEVPPAEGAKIKGDGTVRKMADRGREVLERYYGKEEWRAKAERMRAMWEGFNALKMRGL